MEMMLKVAKEQQERQFILLTPQDMRWVTGVKCHCYILLISQGRGLRFSCKDRTEEVNKFYMIWPV